MAQSSIAISNTSSTTVSISHLNVSGQTFSVIGSDATIPINIPPGGSHTLSVGFAPVDPTTYSGQITMLDASSKPVAQISLQGTGANGAIFTVSSASLSFGSVTVNGSMTQSLILTSTGTSPVTVSSGTITGAGFSIVAQSFPVTLNPTQSLTLQVQFSPTTTGAASGQLTINSNSSTGSTTVVTLSGTSIAVPSPQLTVSSASLSFGNMTVNTSMTQSLALTSTGTSPVTVSSATITGAGFSIVAQSFPVTLNPTQSLTLQIQFSPTTTGAASGQLIINSNSSTGSTTVVTLSGTSMAANPQLTIDTTSLSFGSVPVNTSTTKSLTLTSTGASPVTVNSAAVTGAGFTIIGGSFPVTLNPMQTLTLQVQFAPSAVGTVTGQLSISSNSNGGSTAVVALSGTGSAVPHEVDLSWDAPASSPDPVAGYNIYRSTGSSTTFQLLNQSVVTQTTYVDTAVLSGTVYSYYVESVDASGVQSGPSNEITVTIP